MADLSATEGANDETDKAQAESEPIYTEIALVKPEGSDEAKAVPEKKRGFKIKAPNIKTPNIKTPNFKGFFKRSADSKAGKQKAAEERSAEEKPAQDKVI